MSFLSTAFIYFLISFINFFMKIKKYFAGVMVLMFMAVPIAMAQGSLNIDLELSGTVAVDQDVTVIVEVTDGAGELLGDNIPELSFDPESAYENEVVYDCGNADEYDDCQANNRGVEGVYEAVFTLLDSPVTMTVKVGGGSKEIEISAASGSASASTSGTVSGAAAGSASTTAATASSASSVTVGPSPSIWLFLVPLVLMCGVVIFFVAKTK